MHTSFKQAGVRRHFATHYFQFNFRNNQRVDMPQGIKVVEISRAGVTPYITFTFKGDDYKMVPYLFKVTRYRWPWHRGKYIGYAHTERGQRRYFYLLENA